MNKQFKHLYKTLLNYHHWLHNQHYLLINIILLCKMVYNFMDLLDMKINNLKYLHYFFKVYQIIQLLHIYHMQIKLFNIVHYKNQYIK